MRYNNEMKPEKTNLYTQMMAGVGTFTIVFMMGFASGWYAHECLESQADEFELPLEGREKSKAIAGNLKVSPASKSQQKLETEEICLLST